MTSGASVIFEWTFKKRGNKASNILLNLGKFGKGHHCYDLETDSKKINASIYSKDCYGATALDTQFDEGDPINNLVGLYFPSENLTIMGFYLRCGSSACNDETLSGIRALCENL